MFTFASLTIFFFVASLFATAGEKTTFANACGMLLLCAGFAVFTMFVILIQH